MTSLRLPSSPFAPECIFCDGRADTTINNGKTDCCKKCKEAMRKESEKANEVNFESMAKLVSEMKAEPFATEIRVDPKAHRILKEFANAFSGDAQTPKVPINVYNGGMPVYVYKNLNRGQWQAVDRHGKVLQEGNFIPSAA